MSKTNLKRRKFMLAVGAGSAGAVTVALTGNKANDKAEIAAKDPTAPGYHVTSHIRNYYRTTRV
ncbi:MAG: formate dehydrogenase [Burkholderiales bacterium]